MSELTGRTWLRRVGLPTLALGLALLTGDAAAQDEASEPAPVDELDEPGDDEAAPPGDNGLGDTYETVIVGSRRLRLLFQESRAIDLVGERELAERPGRTVTDLLDDEVSVHAQHTNRGAGAPIIRGQVGPSNLIVFDGVRMDNGTFRTGPTQYLNLYDPSVLGRIEVLRGPGGVLYGSDAIGGVIHLFPRRLEYGRGLGSRGEVTYQSADDGVRLAPEVTWSSTHWSTRLGGSLGFYDDLRVGGGELVPASDYRKLSANASVGWLPHPENELSVSYYGTFVLDTGRIDRLEDGNFREIDNTNHLVYARLSHLGDGTFEEATATLSINLASESVARNDCTLGNVYGLLDVDGEPIETSVDPAGCIDGDFEAIRRVGRNEDDVLQLGGSAVINSVLPLDGLSLLWGVDLYQSFIDSTARQLDKPGAPDPDDPEALVATDVRGNFSDDSRYGYYGGFLRATQEIAVADDWLTRLQFGLRVTHVRAFAPSVPDLGDVEYDDTGVTGSAHLAFLLPNRLTLYGGLSQGFRPPNLQETTQLGDTGNFFEVPNPDLDSERAAQYELGARGVFGPVFVGAAAYVLQIRDVITREPSTFRGQAEVNGTPVVRRINADEGSFVGVEAQAALRLHDNVTVRGNVSWIRGRIEEGEGDDEVELTARRLPPLRWLAALRFEWPRPRVYAELLARGAGPQEDLNPGDESDLRICGSEQFPGVLVSELDEECLGTEGWWELGFRAGMTLLDRVDLRLALTNLLDERYRLHGSGFDAPGFGATLSLVFRL